jgi:hypothetical protein
MSGLERDDILRMVREVADKDKVDPVHNDMVTLTVDELSKLLAAERNRTWTKDHWTAYEHSIAAAEREAILKIARNCRHSTHVIETNPPLSMGVQTIIDAILARGNDAA